MMFCFIDLIFAQLNTQSFFFGVGKFRDLPNEHGIA